MMPMRLLWICFAALLAAAQAGAHEMPKSSVLLDFRSQKVEAELQLPIDRLQVALRHDGTGEAALDAAAMLGPARARVAAYVMGHVQAASKTGTPWSVQLLGLEEKVFDGIDSLVVRLAMQPPTGAPVNVFDLRYDVIIRELVTHTALVSVRTDWRSGVAPDTPELVGAVGLHRPHLLIDRSNGSAWRGVRNIFLLGVNHIAEGTDHLLFLLTLLLPAPLLAVGGRWASSGRPARSVLQAAKIVTAFTVGHSLTLLLGALELVTVPSSPVEILIAASILVSAVHAMRPVFPGREFLVAAGFGLVHGLSFATVISGLGLDRWGLALGIFGFNLGIEAMQLAVVVATMPWLVLLSTTRAYSAFRMLGAGFAAAAAVGWIAERALDCNNPVGPVVDVLATHAFWVVATLAVTAVIAKAGQRLFHRHIAWALE